jgi:hypothetical protein
MILLAFVEMVARLESIVSATGAADWRAHTNPQLSLPQLSSVDSILHHHPSLSAGRLHDRHPSLGTTPTPGLDIPAFPTSVSLNINSPEDLAAVNAFLLALGRDVTSAAHHRSATAALAAGAAGLGSAAAQQALHPLLQPRRNNDYIPQENWFNDDGLAQVGLVGLPGLPTSHLSSSTLQQEADAAYLRNLQAARYLNQQQQQNQHHQSHHHHNRQSHPLSASSLASLYPGLDIGLSRLDSRDSNSHHHSSNLFADIGNTLAHTPPAVIASPLSTTSSTGSSHSASTPLNGSSSVVHSSGGAGGLDSGTSASSNDFGLYDSSKLRVSFDSLKPPSPPSLLLQTPALGPRPGAGLLGTGPKQSLFLQTSVRKMQEEAAKRAIEEEGRDEDEEVDELEDEEITTPTTVKRAPLAEAGDSDEEEEADVSMKEESVAYPRASSPAAVDMSPEEIEEDSDSQESEGSTHQPGHSLYPLLKQEGDPRLKLPALAITNKYHHHHHIAAPNSMPMYPKLTPVRRWSQDSQSSSEGRSSSSLSRNMGDISLTTPPNGKQMTLPPLTSVVVSSPPSSPRSDLSQTLRDSELGMSPRYNHFNPILKLSSVSRRPFGRISHEERLRHATLIRSLMLYINTEYVKKYGVTGEGLDSRPATSSSSLSALHTHGYQRSRTPIEDRMELDSPVGYVPSAA